MGRAGCSGCNTKSLKRENKRQKQAYGEGFLFQGHVLNTNSLESLSKQSFVLSLIPRKWHTLLHAVRGQSMFTVYKIMKNVLCIDGGGNFESTLQNRT